MLRWSRAALALAPEGGAKRSVFRAGEKHLGDDSAINLRPFMRFDGYSWLSDLLDVPNLHEPGRPAPSGGCADFCGLDERFPEPGEVLGGSGGLIVFAYIKRLYAWWCFSVSPSGVNTSSSADRHRDVCLELSVRLQAIWQGKGYWAGAQGQSHALAPGRGGDGMAVCWDG